MPHTLAHLILFFWIRHCFTVKIIIAKYDIYSAGCIQIAQKLQKFILVMPGAHKRKERLTAIYPNVQCDTCASTSILGSFWQVAIHRSVAFDVCGVQIASKSVCLTFSTYKKAHSSHQQLENHGRHQYYL